MALKLIVINSPVRSKTGVTNALFFKLLFQRVTLPQRSYFCLNMPTSDSYNKTYCHKFTRTISINDILGPQTVLRVRYDKR